MVAKTRFVKFVLVAVALLAAGQGFAQNELRKTFFREADAARAEAEAQNASLLAPRTWERAMKEYSDAEELLERGRNIEYVRDNASDAARYFREAAEKAERAEKAAGKKKGKQRKGKQEKKQGNQGNQQEDQCTEG